MGEPISADMSEFRKQLVLWVTSICELYQSKEIIAQGITS